VADSLSPLTEKFMRTICAFEAVAICDLKLEQHAKSGPVVPIERIESCLLLIRGHKVMLDADLARKHQDEYFLARP
jgi:hypothetical protein